MAYKMGGFVLVAVGAILMATATLREQWMLALLSVLPIICGVIALGDRHGDQPETPAQRKLRQRANAERLVNRHPVLSSAIVRVVAFIVAFIALLAFSIGTARLITPLLYR